MGAPKNNEIEKKHKLELLPLDLLGLVADTYDYGLQKYYHNSHRKGFMTDTMISAALRHISNWNDEGQEFDLDAYEKTGEKVHHIAMAIFNLLSVLEAITYYPDKVRNFIRPNFKSQVPIDDLPELVDRIERLRKFWSEEQNINK